MELHSHFLPIGGRRPAAFQEGPLARPLFALRPSAVRKVKGCVNGQPENEFIILILMCYGLSPGYMEQEVS